MEVMQNFRHYTGKVKLADNNTLDITGVGDVSVKTTLGTNWILKDVKFIPDLKRMLISVGQLDDEGHQIEFGDGQWKVTKGSMVIARGRKRGTLYMVEVTNSEVNAVEEDQKTSTLWHQRLGQMSEKGMKMLASKGSIPDLKKVTIDFCEPCVMGKQKKVSFLKSGNPPTSGKLELIHSDVYVGGARYYVTFIDDCTRKVWVYFLKQKSEVFSEFKKWRATVENKTNLKIKCFRSDNGGEYSSNEFVDYCAENGIRMMKTVPENPQQNGVAERMNRTLCERAKSMRLNAGLPKMFWADAVNTAAYLINRGPSVPLGFKIPEEVWTGRPATLKHLRFFGCVSYVKIKDSKRDKLESKARKCTFIGYGGDEMVTASGIMKINALSKVALYKDTLAGGSNSEEEQMKTNGQVEYEAKEEEEEDVLKPVSSPELGESSGSSASSSDDVGEGRSEDGADGAEPVAPALRRSTRLANLQSGTVLQSLGVNNSIQWKKAMEEEMNSLEKNKTWFLVKLPNGKKALQNKWVFRVKDEIDSSKRYKARLVVKGFQQKQGVDYNEIFSPVVNMTTIRLVLGIVASEDLHLEQMDVKTAFLHGDLDEDIYMMQLEGFPAVGKENLVCKLKKSLYGLKQAPRQWYLRLDSFMRKSGYNRCEMDHCCY
ncbi:hypothetical protein LXL04_019963 [Taraxacum kok-saghyz]